MNADRCGNEACKFHAEPLVWNGRPLPLIAVTEKVDGPGRFSVTHFFCPNCADQWKRKRAAKTAE